MTPYRHRGKEHTDVTEPCGASPRLQVPGGMERDRVIGLPMSIA